MKTLDITLIDEWTNKSNVPECPYVLGAFVNFLCENYSMQTYYNGKVPCKYVYIAERTEYGFRWIIQYP